MDNFWADKCVCVTGGAAMIGSMLCEALLRKGVKNLWVADDFSSGKQEYLPKELPIIDCDLSDSQDAEEAVNGADVVFHLAAAHGGRGYVSNHKIEFFNNIALDQSVFSACADRGVKKVVYASSACAYPIENQMHIGKPVYLSEGMIDYNNLKQPDGMYGLSKLVGEMALDSYIEAGAFEGVACRMFTVYGPRMSETSAILALIAKAFVKQDPYEVWGKPRVVRNFTYVTDTVDGLMRAAKMVVRGAANIGSEQDITIERAAEVILETMDYNPRTIEWKTEAPIGVLNRVSDSTFSKLVLGWKEDVNFRQGIINTVDWYTQTHSVDEVRAKLSKSLTER